MPGRLVFAEAAWEDCLHWQRHDRPQLERIHRLIETTRREPFTGPGKPEALQHALAGWWSRRVTEEHRMVYRWHDGDLLIAQLRHHYR